MKALLWLGYLVALVVLGVVLLILGGVYVAYYAVLIVLAVPYLVNVTREQLAARKARGLDLPRRQPLP
jgi:hypothetical protein